MRALKLCLVTRQEQALEFCGHVQNSLAVKSLDEPLKKLRIVVENQQNVIFKIVALLYRHSVQRDAFMH